MREKYNFPKHFFPGLTVYELLAQTQYTGERLFMIIVWNELMQTHATQQKWNDTNHFL